MDPEKSLAQRLERVESLLTDLLTRVAALEGEPAAQPEPPEPEPTPAAIAVSEPEPAAPRDVV